MKPHLIAGMFLAAACAIAFEERQAVAAGNAHVGFGVPGHCAVAVRDNMAYVPPGKGDFTILDVSDKSRPRVGCNNSNMTIDDERNILFVCKYMQVERFDIGEPEKPRFVSKLHLVTR